MTDEAARPLPPLSSAASRESAAYPRVPGPNPEAPPKSAPMDDQKTEFPRHELKIVLDESALKKVTDWLRATPALAPDTFVGGDGRYLVHSLYFDSPSLAVYHRAEEDSGTKYRIRRYGDENVLWLERKRRKGTLVTKRRASCPMEKLDGVLKGTVTLGGFADTFVEEVKKQRYSPRLLVTYPRSAWVAEGGARLTLDHGVQARKATKEQPFSETGQVVSVSSDVILELKYDKTPPSVFTELLTLLGQEGGSFSKYRRGIEAVGMVMTRTKSPSSPPAPKPR